MLPNRINIQLESINKEFIYIEKQRNMTKCIGIIFAIYY